MLRWLRQLLSSASAARPRPEITAFPESWRRTLSCEVAFYERLPSRQRERLLVLIVRFVDEKQWWGAENLVVTDEMKVIVAAYACLLVLENQDFGLYPRTKEVILYPREFGARVTAIAPDGTAHDVEDLLLGETHYRGPVLLAWDSIKPPLRNAKPPKRRNAEIRTRSASEGPPAGTRSASKEPLESRTSATSTPIPGGSEPTAPMQQPPPLPSSAHSAFSADTSLQSLDAPHPDLQTPAVERLSPASGDVILHEFAHALDSLDGLWDGTPPLGCDPRLADWVRVFTEEYETLVRAAERGRRTFLDPYGAEDPTEFFAVATEAFFLEPNRMKRHHASLYQQLAALYRQDPAQWMDA
ncbi:MAG: zinc-dependent peptidase [Phycisphaerales bacterium]|nr:zinc-dependent peptidase [Phycisphaerales bacterium]